MAATLRDVASLAGVSISTASRALSGDGSRPVAAATQLRIAEAVRRLGYAPNDAARQLVRGNGQHEQPRRTGAVGLILGRVSYKFSDPFWSPVLDGVDEELVRRHYHLRFALTLDDLQQPQQRRLLNRAQIDGLIVVGGHDALQAMTGIAGWTQETLDSRLTVVIEGGDDRLRWQGPRIDLVVMEKRHAIYSVVDHLVSLGRRHLVFLGPPPAKDERAEAFAQALASHDLPLPPEHLVNCPWTTEGAYPVAAGLLAEHAGRIDALVCACDTIAIGALRAARERGLRVPADLALTGFDDIPFARDLDPPLTTVGVPKALMGKLAARKLLERLDEPDLPPIVQTVPTSLVIRASCGAGTYHRP